MKINVSLDNERLYAKPTDHDKIRKISTRIANQPETLTLEELANLVGNKGQTFAPAIFNGSRKAENVKELQLLVLDFDNTEEKYSITFREAIERCDELGIPISFIYETFSSENCSKFRIVFTYFEPVVNLEFYKILLAILFEIFPEADHHTSDLNRMFYGGKGLIKEVNNDLIYPENLFLSLYQYYNINNKEKVKRVKNFCFNNNIAVINNTFYTEIVESDKVKSFATPILYNISGEKVFTDEIFIIHQNTEQNKLTEIRNRFSDNKIRHVSDTDLNNSCKLIKEFENGSRWLYYPEIWGILTNLVHIEGGLKYFRRTINNLRNSVSYPYNYKKWELNCMQISKSPYAPKRCKKYCPFSDKCRHSKNIITTINTNKKQITVLENAEEYTDIDKARQELYEAVKSTICSKDNAVHIINAQTGIGKTYAYIKCIKELGINCIIAVPNNKLKDEVYDRMRKNGIDAVATPEIPRDISPDERMILDDFYKKGDKYGCTSFMKKLSNKYKSVKYYRKFLPETMNYKGNIVTTHFRLLYQFSEEVLNSHIIIIDEDIIPSICNIEKINLSSIKYVLKKPYITGQVKERIENYIKRKENEIDVYKKHIDEYKIYLTRKQKKLIGKDTRINFNVENFINADATLAGEKEVYYAWLKELPLQKTIVLSATADRRVYAEFFKNRCIEEYKINEVKYLGKVVQRIDESYSRSWINNNPEKYNEIKELYKSDDYYEICFKKYEDEHTALHFGAVQGTDKLSDKDMVILGTPFPNDKVCRLMAAAIDYDIDIINKDKMNFREVEYAGKYRFYFFTFKDELLKRLHIYHISSELEQAVGRSRLISNNNTVHVYSSFPVKTR